ncbi:MAG: c-type cytochrome [Salinisphaera sp.]|nr:c-type cytochrome [Salinisphaera sp.]
MNEDDQTFVRRFGVVIGILAAFGVLFAIMAIFLVNFTEPEDASPERVARLAKITDPVFSVTTDPAKLQKVAMTTGQGGGSKSMTGKQVFTKVCSACHGTGVMGAPKFGNSAAWQPRIAAGKQTLYKHAIHGYNKMPPQGATLPEAAVKKGVDYMVGHAGGW